MPNYELEDFLLEEQNMNTLFQVSWTNVKSALIYALLIAIVEGIGFIISAGSVFSVEWHGLVNAMVLPALVFIVSIIKNFLTTAKGNFVGVVKVIPPTN